MRRNPKQQGFTLIEVMIAVAILGVALPALLFSMISQLQSNGYMRDKILATWVAENVLNELRIENSLSGQVKKGKDEGVVEMGLQRWFWKSESKAFAQKQFSDIYGVEIFVYKEDQHGEKDQHLARLVGMVREFKRTRVEMPAAENAESENGEPKDENNATQ